ncbi:hypothetical protein LOK49_LG10G01066 [Camellia lanceoleosa]|uniref:Uncharacterized protein n=1 Tax=Camellia lanceoleosa TaxID=1840588 RepID=A0ACC0GDB8_9ERIC|nr:hypothetical protein LOK49_LG10G01066 [Camellia lanceoleosa]
MHSLRLCFMKKIQAKSTPMLRSEHATTERNRSERQNSVILGWVSKVRISFESMCVGLLLVTRCVQPKVLLEGNEKEGDERGEGTAAKDLDLHRRKEISDGTCEARRDLKRGV